VTWVLTGRNTARFWVDIERGVVREISGIDDENHPLQIHTSAYIFRRCMAQNLFLHLSLSRRVLFRCCRADARYFDLLILLFNLYESGMLPAWKLLTPRFLRCWLPRWREAAHYAGRILRGLRLSAFTINAFASDAFAARDDSGSERPAESAPLSPGTAYTRGRRPKTAAIAVPEGSQL
jgi:hypothetical protein